MSDPTQQASDYMVLHVNDADDLARLVNAWIAKGWRLQGGVSIAISTSEDRNGYCVTETTFAQAVVKS